ncbi:flagellar basal body-associated protein FliL [Lachnospiraceae bacterium PH1-22]
MKKKIEIVQIICIYAISFIGIMGYLYRYSALYEPLQIVFFVLLAVYVFTYFMMKFRKELR